MENFLIAMAICFVYSMIEKNIINGVAEKIKEKDITN